MNYANWETIESMLSQVPLIPINRQTEVKSSGLPMAYDEENIYISGRKGHSLIIGSTGSGKTQTVTLPMLELSLKSGESVVIHDSNSELYNETKDKFINEGYKVLKINFDDPRNCNSWNPFELPYRLYTEGNKDKAQEMIENLGFYLFNDKGEQSNDPFWINSAINYFTGLTLYMFDKEEEIHIQNLSKIDTIARSNPEKFMEEVKPTSRIGIYLSGILNAPTETRGSIFSVYSQKMRLYLSRENLMHMLTKSDFNIANVGSEKTIIYIISGNSSNSQQLLPLFISQLYYAKDEYSKNIGTMNIMIDDFFILNPIKDFSKMLNYSRSIHILFTIMVRGYNDLKNTYGYEESEIIKICFANTVYLLSQDIATLEEISRLCGNTSLNGVVKPLISVEELKTLKTFEAIILTVRMMPFKTKLLPYYKIEF